MLKALEGYANEVLVAIEGIKFVLLKSVAADGIDIGTGLVRDDEFKHASQPFARESFYGLL